MKVCQNRGNGEIGVRSHSEACVVPEIPVRRCVIEHSDLCHRMLQPLNLFSLWFPSKVAGDFQLSLMAFMFNAKPGNSLVHSLPVSHFILCCFPVESSNTPFPFAKLQASHRGTTRWLSQALRVGKKLHVPPDSQTQRLCSCCLSWEWVGEAWVYHISSNPHNQLMARLVKTGVTKSRGLSV